MTIKTRLAKLESKTPRDKNSLIPTNEQLARATNYATLLRGQPLETLHDTERKFLSGWEQLIIIAKARKEKDGHQ